MVENRRQDRVSALIQRELSEVIHRDVKDHELPFAPSRMLKYQLT